MASTVLPLDQMTLAEKLRALEELWDDLSRTPANIPPPDWHGQVLEERAVGVKEGRSRFTPWPEAKEEIRDLAKGRK